MGRLFDPDSINEDWLPEDEDKCCGGYGYDDDYDYLYGEEDLERIMDDNGD